MKFLSLSLVLCSVFTIAGCSPKQDQWEKDRPKVYQVSGKVTQGGQPIEGAVVSFYSENQTATGVTDAAGKYSLTTFKEGDGAVAGQQKVTISKASVKNVPTKYHTAAEPSFQMVKTETLPETVADLNKTTLTADVQTSSKSNSLDFDIPAQ